MTISSTSSTSPIYAGNDTTGPWAFTFKTFEEAELEVTQVDADGVETILVLTSEYSVSLNADQNNDPGGEVTTVNAVPIGESLIIRWAGDATQGTDIQNAGGFLPEVVENALDKLTMLNQKLAEEVDRAVKVSITDNTDPDALVLELVTAASDADTAATAASASAAAAAVSAAAVAAWQATFWKGDWSNATAYAVNDAVANGGSSYICIQAHTNHEPPNASYWDVLAAQGTAGAGTGDMLAANNLSDVANVATARSNLGLTSASQAEMEAGTEANLRAMSPLRIAQAIAALTPAASTDLLPTKQVFDTSLGDRPGNSTTGYSGWYLSGDATANSLTVAGSLSVYWLYAGPSGASGYAIPAMTANCLLAWSAAKNPKYAINMRDKATNGTRYWGLFSAAAPANGIYFRHTLAGSIYAVCRASSVETATDTGISASTSVTRSLRFEVTGGGTSVDFYVDDVLKATTTTNIPSASLMGGFAVSTLNVRVYVGACHIEQEL